MLHEDNNQVWPEITMATSTIHNPAEPRHFMQVKPVNSRVRILHNGRILADTTHALRLLEVGKDFYDPTLYLPRSALAARFELSDKTTHCPLKGDASYLNLVDDDGNLIGENIAWTYVAPFEFANQIENHVAFYSDQVTTEEHPS